MTHICVDNLTTIVSDNGLSPVQSQAIIWTNAGILLIGPLGTNVSEILIGILTFSFKEIHFKMWPAKCRPSILSWPKCVKLPRKTGVVLSINYRNAALCPLPVWSEIQASGHVCATKSKLRCSMFIQLLQICGCYKRNFMYFMISNHYSKCRLIVKSQTNN